MTILHCFHERQRFAPGAFGWLVNPFYHARRGLLAGLADFFPLLQGEVLDVGCGSKPYRSRLAVTRYVGVDVDTPVTRGLAAADVFYDGRRLPFPDGSFDGVLCSQVLEHVFQPGEFLSEVHRVLRPGGRLLLATPFVWDEHEQPFDFARYSSFALPHLLRQAGLEVVAQHKSCADGRAVVQLASGYVYKITRTRSRPLNLAAQLLLIAPVNVLGGLIAWVLPKNPDFYLDNIVLARKPATT